jgi:hypothetical protein
MQVTIAANTNAQENTNNQTNTQSFLVTEKQTDLYKNFSLCPKIWNLWTTQKYSITSIIEPKLTPTPSPNLNTGRTLTATRRITLSLTRFSIPSRQHFLIKTKFSINYIFHSFRTLFSWRGKIGRRREEIFALSCNCFEIYIFSTSLPSFLLPLPPQCV